MHCSSYIVQTSMTRKRRYAIACRPRRRRKTATYSVASMQDCVSSVLGRSLENELCFWVPDQTTALTFGNSPVE